MKTNPSQLSASQWLLRSMNAGLVTGMLGIVAIWSSTVWLIPSLGPSILMQCFMPRADESRFRHVVLGQLLGVAAGILAVTLAGAIGEPSELATGMLRPAQVIAAALSVVATLLLQIRVRALHPPAASTALMWALGSISLTPSGLVSTVVAITLVGVLGEPVRRWEANRLPADWRRI